MTEAFVNEVICTALLLDPDKLMYVRRSRFKGKWNFMLEESTGEMHIHFAQYSDGTYGYELEYKSKVYKSTTRLPIPPGQRIRKKKVPR
jgi:hypothetical protein